MTAKILAKRRLVIPEAIRKQAHVHPGDHLDVGCANGLIILRKRQALRPARVRSLILAGKNFQYQHSLVKRL
jgi:AbrB family looped-hinge helix DNA binding protein